MAVTKQDVLKAHMHIGNIKKLASTKTRSFWLDIKNGLVIIDPDKIATQLDNAKAKFQEAKKAGKEVLIICEKTLYADEIAQMGSQGGFHYLNYKVPAGFLTNFDTLITRIRGMNELRSFIESEDFHKLTKKEQLTQQRKLKKVERIYKGVKNLKKRPELVIVVDGKSMMKFVKELEKIGLDNIVIASTNFDTRWNKDNLVIANVDSYQSLDFGLSYILNA